MSFKDEHEKLLEDLAETLVTIYKNVPLGSVMLQQPQLADIIAIKPSYTRFCLTIYEIKVSRSDFLSDVRSGKWEGYLEHCHRFYFATGKDIVTKSDIPAGAGWICKGEKGWGVRKASPVYDTDIPKETLLSMLFMRDREPLRGKHMDRVLNYFYQYADSEKRVRLLGHNIADAYAKKEEYLGAKEHYRSVTRALREAIRVGLDIPEAPYEQWTEWDLERLIDKIKDFKKSAEKQGII